MQLILRTVLQFNLFTAFVMPAFAGVCFTASTGGALAQDAPGVVFTPLHSFGAGSDGTQPNGGLVQGSDGNFYGAADGGGAYGYGTVFKMTPTGVATTLYSFTGGPDGGYPQGLNRSSDGSFYGATEGGSTSTSFGTVFKITSSGTLTTLYSFTEGSDGGRPYCAPLQAPDGNFYGTTLDGPIYKLTPPGSFTTLPSSSNENQFAPIIDTDGNLYGTTGGGGAYGRGYIYRLTPADSATILYSFTGGTDGSAPRCQLAIGSDGNFYGTTEYGGANGSGTIFKVTPTGALTTLHSFGPLSSSTYTNTDGDSPYQGLITATDGNFYGITSSGGANDTGTIYQITPSGSYTVLHTFSAVDDNGENADGAGGWLNVLTESSDGSIYGNTNFGGAYGSGTAFRLTIPGLAKSTLRFDFNKDGHSDLVWYNTGTGGVSVWDMDDQSVLSYGATFTQLAPSSGWVPVATPDINADGYPDLLWWNTNTGELSFWTLSNTTVLHYYGDFATVADTDWKPVAAADVTGTTWELVFQNTATGAISAWDMNGQTVTSYGPTLATLGANTPYQVVGAPDLDGDGKSDLLFWDSQTGGVSYWSCNLAASQVLSYHSDFTSLDDTSWHLVGSEDTNGDGHSDLLWWNAGTGEVSRWLLSGTTVTNYGGETATVPDTAWQPTAIR